MNGIRIYLSFNFNVSSFFQIMSFCFVGFRRVEALGVRGWELLNTKRESVFVCTSVCEHVLERWKNVCECVGARERETERERQTEKQCVCVCVCVCLSTLTLDRISF